MGVVIRQSILSTIISYIGIAIGTFNVLWLYPKFLSPEQVGLLRLLQDIPSLFALFVRLGATSVVDRFFSYFKDEDSRHHGFFFFILAYPMLGFIGFLFSFWYFNDFWASLYVEKSALLVHYFFLIIPLTFFMMYTDIIESYLRVHLKISFTNFLKEVLLRILFTLCITVFAFNWIGFDGLVWLYSGCYGIILLIIAYYLFQNGLFHWRPNWTIWNHSKMKEIKDYLIYIIPGSAGGIIAQKIDNLMIAAISGDGFNEGLTNVAIYSIAYFIGSVVEVPRKNIAQISTPILSAAFKENDLPLIKNLYQKNAIIQLISGALLFSLIWINIDDLFLFIPNREIYLAGKYVILFIALTKLVDMTTSINTEIIQFSAHYRFNMISIVLLSFITVITSWILIPIHGINGAAIALFSTICIFNFVKTLFIYIKMGLNPFTNAMWVPWGYVLFILLVTPYLQWEGDSLLKAVLSIGIRSIVIGGIFLFFVRKFNLSSDISSLMDTLLSKVIKK